MCGIVVYYGDAENRITRVLSGMWAIVYRAPDSTGLGLIGSELEPMKIRRELGSFEPFIDRLIDAPVFDETELGSVALMTDDLAQCSDIFAENQRKLLSYEGFGGGFQRSCSPSWAELINVRKEIVIEPGMPGKAGIQERFLISSVDSLKNVIDRLCCDFDLPLGVIEKLLHRAFVSRITQERKDDSLAFSKEELLGELHSIFYQHAYEEELVDPHHQQPISHEYPLLRDEVLRLLENVEILLPADYSTDGIVNLFRSLDSSVLTMMGVHPEIDDGVQAVFENFWGRHKSTPPVHWRTLYRTERLFNVYGLAAASVLAYYQADLYRNRMVRAGCESCLPPEHLPGHTHPLLLRSMIQPVVGQGRWAVQSAISVSNAHPFTDERKERAVVLNGMFSAEVEEKLKAFVTKVAGIRLRSENSTELFAMLWGYYYETLAMDKSRYRMIDRQHQLGLKDISVASESVDFGIFRKLEGKTSEQLDEMAFIKTCEVMIADGGQFAVSGISRLSPDRLFVATHKRPVYIVKRLETFDFMVVSDVNAAIGLFPQALIQDVGKKLRMLMAEYSKKSVIVEPTFFKNREIPDDSWFKQRKMALLEPFGVEIYSLSQERIFALIKTQVGHEDVLRDLNIYDFDGKPRSDIQPEETYLAPLTYKKDYGRSFYEEHLQEIPTLIGDLLNRYCCRESDTIDIGIKTRLLVRRFGKNLADLNRIILVSTGTSFLLSEIVEKNMEQFLTGINIMEASPYEFGNLGSDINPDRDLVVLISWSGTTADIVEFASRLVSRNVLVVGVTEKPYSDLALIVRKSVGIIPVLCGEEVTLVATKSAVCTLQALYLLCLYLAGEQKTDKKEEITRSVQEMRQLPAKIEQLLADENIIAFCREVSLAGQKSSVHLLVDALHDVGTSRIGAMNLEINAWNSMGIAVDCSTLKDPFEMQLGEDDLVLVNATTTGRLSESVALMTDLKNSGILFYSVTYRNREEKRIRECAEKTVLIPKTLDFLQPLVDLTFMFLLGFYFGLARGRVSGQMPRNLTKSITAGRAKNRQALKVVDIINRIAEQNQAASQFSAGAGQNEQLAWLKRCSSEDEKGYYAELIDLATLLQSDPAIDKIFMEFREGQVQKLAKMVFNQLAEDGIIILVPMDRAAEGGCRNFVRCWSHFFSTPMQVEFPEKIEGVSMENSLMVVVASEIYDPGQLELFAAFFPEDLVWVGPDSGGKFDDLFAHSQRYFFKEKQHHCHNEQVYLGLSLLFGKILSYGQQKLSGLLAEHFRMFLPALKTVFSDDDLYTGICRFVTENRTYRKRIFITGLRGSCTYVKEMFSRDKSVSLESEIFGVSAHTHLVLVDPAVRDKYVRLGTRRDLLKHNSESMVRSWEKRFLGGQDIDAFLENPAGSLPSEIVGPFMYENDWYLPVIRPEYDTNEDCLIIIDATSETSFDIALDELAAFGSRYARLIVITQESFAVGARLATLEKYPVSEIILIPAMKDSQGGTITLSDYILPLVINAIAVAMYHRGVS